MSELPNPPALTPIKPKPRAAELALLASVFVVAACGLVYELTAGALASYLLGDSILQFSTIIGAYLFAMGVGSYLSRFIEHNLSSHFLRIELFVGLVGGLMPAALFMLHAHLSASAALPFRISLYGLVILIGILVGLEIPLVMRLLKKQYALKDLVSQVLTFDYLGALIVSIAFPLVFVPHMGLIRTGLFFGLLNVLIAVWALWLFRHQLQRFNAHAFACAACVALLLVAFAAAERITTWGEDKFYHERVIYSASSPYQRIVLTQARGDVRLFLNGNLQFSSRDEYRYHESLVHPAMSAHAAPKRIAVLGGGDGMAVREILKYPSVESVTLIELDANMTQLFSEQALMRKLNADSLLSPKVYVQNSDAFSWLEDAAHANEIFDVIVVDFPDPTNFSLGKLYSTAFYTLLDQHLSASGYAVIQTTSPLIARKSFWTVAQTLEAVNLRVAPYHAHVPSFGEWGFIIASRRPYVLPTLLTTTLPEGLRFIDVKSLPLLFDFPRDMSRVQAGVNKLNNQVLVQTFEEEWGKVQ
jgi:spermidine synthase